MITTTETEIEVSKLRAAAVRAIERGLLIFPCHRRDKRPLACGEEKYADGNPKRCAGNPAIACGVYSN